MQTKSVLELADVKIIAAAAEAEALKNKWAVTIAIVDDGGHLLHLARLDGAPPISAHIAPAWYSTRHGYVQPSQETQRKSSQTLWPW